MEIAKILSLCRPFRKPEDDEIDCPQHVSFFIVRHNRLRNANGPLAVRCREMSQLAGRAERKGDLGPVCKLRPGHEVAVSKRALVSTGQPH